MSTYQNGNVPVTAMRNVSGGTLLLNPVAQAFRNLQLVCRYRYHWAVTPAPGIGSGYRSLAVQRIYWDAAHGDAHAQALTHLSSQSIIAVAWPGGSSHGVADRVDMLFDGANPTQQQLGIAGAYGFTREFGADDPDHFAHDHQTGVSHVWRADQIAAVAQQLNGQRLEHDGTVVSSPASNTGNEDADFIWMVQHAGHRDGTYPASCREDGVTGPFTERSLSIRWDSIAAG